MTIGNLARAAQVSADTIRFYERRGLIPRPARTLSDYRNYSHRTVHRVRFIRDAKALGFTLAEIRALLELGQAGAGDCRALRARCLEKRRQLAARVCELRRMQRALERLLGRCDTGGPGTACPAAQQLRHAARA
jgi:DNA-binding transcriptional MerR regulator